MVQETAGYQTIRKLTAGSDAEIFLVRRVSDGRSFVMKLAFPVKHSLDAIRTEHRLLSDLHHPNLLAAHDLVRVDGREGLIIDYFPGRSLRLVMHEPGRALVRQLGYIVEQIGDVLSYLHERGICHGDVKPENILVAPGARVRLIDLSIASAGIWGWLLPGKLAGTPKYMAPELIRSKRTTPATDLYALGVVCYEIIAGRAPFDGASNEEILAHHVAMTPPRLREFRKGIDSRIEALVMSALAKDPTARPRYCRTFGRRFSRMLLSPLEAAEQLGMA